MWTQSEFITEEERQELYTWALENQDSLVQNGNEPPGRFFKSIKDLTINLLANRIQYRLLDQFLPTTASAVMDNTYGHFLSFNYPGASIPSHKIPAQEGYVHVRYVLFIQQADIPGSVTCGEDVQPWAERTLIRIDASETEYSSSEVQGEKPLIVLSYGIQMLKEEYDLL